MFSPKWSHWPPIFFISDVTNSSSYSGKSLRKKIMVENFSRQRPLESAEDKKKIMYESNNMLHQRNE